MSGSLRVLAPEELELVAGGSLGDNWWDPNYGIAPGSAYSGMGLNVPVFSVTSWTTSSFGNNYNQYATWATEANYSSTNAFLMANPYSYTPPAGSASAYEPKVTILDNNNNEITSTNGSLSDGVYKTVNPTTGYTEIVLKANVNEILVSANYLADPSWTNFSNIAGFYGLGAMDSLSLLSLTTALKELEKAAANVDALDVNNDGINDIGVKEGIDVTKLSAQIRAAYDEVVSVWSTHAPGIKPVITSTYDSTLHVATSKHYQNQAIDIRGNNIDNSTGYAIAASLQQLLGNDYFVQFEVFADPARDHIHIEYDP